MATRSMNTMGEYLGKINAMISEAKMAPDADLSFLIGLETQIIGKMREPFDNMAGQMPPPPGNAVEMGAGAGMEMMGADMMAQGAGMMPGAGGGVAAGLPGPGGPMPAPPGPRFSPDVMRRALRGGGIQGG